MSNLKLRDKPRCKRITRSIVGGQFRLTPDDDLNEAYQYCLQFAADKHKISVLSTQFLGNSYSLIIDEDHCDSDVSKFEQLLNRDLTVILNKRYGTKRSIWCTGSYDEKPILNLEAFEHYFCKTRTKTVRAGLVNKPGSWPGLNTSVNDLGNLRRRVKRPIELGQDPNRPEELVFELKTPKLIANAVEKESKIKKRLAKSVKQKIREIHETRRRKNLGYLGVRKILAQNPFSSLKTIDKDDQITVTKISLPADDATYSAILQSKVYTDYFNEYKQFCKHYRDAYKKWVNNEPAIFPKGTYKMKLQFNVPCLE